MKEKLKDISGLLIAAGHSDRMNEFKPLMLYHGNTFIIEIIRKMKSICRKIVVVTGHYSEKIQSEIEKHLLINSGISIVFNNDYKKGMFTSLQCGLIELRNTEWVLYHFVDQPGLPEEFYKEFDSQVDENYNWIQPKYNSIKGHPIIFGKEILQPIISAPLDENLKNISMLPIVKKKYWKCIYPQVLQDIDTQDDYKKEIFNEHI
jgi:molybdenum cofactor cytidylyltransferase